LSGSGSLDIDSFSLRKNWNASMTSNAKNRKLLIAGIGNIFFGDDGFGVELARRLIERRAWPEGVRVEDFGIRGYDLAMALTDGWELAILLDAVSRKGTPGTLYFIEPDPISTVYSKLPLDGHSLHPEAVLQLVEGFGGTATRVMILGCEPAEAHELCGIGLSPEVQNAIGPAIEFVEKHVQTMLNRTTPAQDGLCTSSHRNEHY
jgi:hydrogenase maturation protease